MRLLAAILFFLAALPAAEAGTYQFPARVAGGGALLTVSGRDRVEQLGHHFLDLANDVVVHAEAVADVLRNPGLELLQRRGDVPERDVVVVETGLLRFE